ncbi:MAG: bifunctional riboflavin kinase/FAD synthetase [Ferrovum sp.]|jgi:riboflavin kinase/FMN adenylyltransferase|nr:bifunctional riboflavin kinase/FAD synthetase [Ferrovum sp.]NDU89701.1 bifunctional riboflavin kinase/FAD synthetase [Ferrovum sp.]
MKRISIDHLPVGTVGTALTLGNFDGVHRGHQAMLECLVKEAGVRGLVPMVLTFEPYPREFFEGASAPPRLTSLTRKYLWMTQMGVDQVRVLRFNGALAALSAADFVHRVLVQGFSARWVLVGDDFRFGVHRQGDFSLLREMGRTLGFECAALQSVQIAGERISSSAIRACLRAGDLTRAATLLGRSFSLVGRVGYGHQLGRTLGFPTLNLALRHRPPLSGVFVVEVCGPAPHPLPGVASLGHRPTVNPLDAPLLEVHLFDFERTIYGQRVEVRFLHKLRDERHFANTDQLVAQMRADAAAARAYFAQSLIQDAS